MTLAEPIVDPETGEILVNTDTLVTRDVLDLIEPLLDNGLGNFVVEPSDDAVIPEPITLQSIKVYSPKDSERVVTLLSNGNPDSECRVLTPADVISNISYWLGLAEGIGKVDDIDHLGNRRIRSVGELLQNQVRIGLSHMERVIRERMSSSENENITPQV